MGRLDGKIAIVTGGSKGLGEADARLMAAEGAYVYVADVDEAAGRKVAVEIGENAAFAPLDVTDENSWIDLIARVKNTHGKLNILVNNAGVVAPGTIETQTTAEYQMVMSVSADGVFYGCKHALPLMKDSGLCSIINMASIASINGEGTVVAYAAAKGAVESLTRSIAAHCALSKYTIRCNSVHPSTIITPMVMGITGQADKPSQTESVEAMKAMLPSKLGEPNDIGHTIVFLASDEAKFINGAAIRVDAGISIVSGVVPE